ncbi:hypothetical protein J1N35_040469 [Gossypium stocksii]|uniref:Uncharacterized protein n=1 Tax=Gossypium stocksii TaxID=47602 RepID=A0A9D3ZIB6_9ROSI|nr:hypothetical protein J1N35_040469 [Gossypium stocksii]
MKENVSEKISQRCGKRRTKLFYKFPVLSNPIKFSEIELLDNDDVETMVTLYCLLGMIYLIVIETDALGEDGSDNNNCFDHKDEGFSDPDLEDILDNINDE